MKMNNKVRLYILILVSINFFIVSCSNKIPPRDCGPYIGCYPNYRGQTYCTNYASPPYGEKFITYKCNYNTGKFEVANSEPRCIYELGPYEIIFYDANGVPNPVDDPTYIVAEGGQAISNTFWEVANNLKYVLCNTCTLEYPFTKEFALDQATTIFNGYYRTCTIDPKKATQIPCEANSNCTIKEPFVSFAGNIVGDYVIPYYTTNYIDTRSEQTEITDQTSKNNGSRDVVLFFQIAAFNANYDNTFNSSIVHEILVFSKVQDETDKTKYNYKLIKNIPIGCESNSTPEELLNIEPACNPAQIATVRGSVKAELYLDDDEIESDKDIEYYFAIKKTYPTQPPSTACATHPLLKDGEYACISEIPVADNTKIIFKNYEKRTNDRLNTEFTTRQMNIFIGANGGDVLDLSKATKSDGTTFKTCFENAWSNITTSDIHVVPNYLPKEDDEASSDSEPNLEPKSIKLPEILVDLDGNMVLYSMDLEEEDNKKINEVYEYYGAPDDDPLAIDRVNYAILMWQKRMYKYLALYQNTTFTKTDFRKTDISQKELDAEDDVLNLNFSPILMINGIKAYDVTPEIIDADKIYSYSEEDSDYAIPDRASRTPIKFETTLENEGLLSVRNITYTESEAAKKNSLDNTIGTVSRSLSVIHKDRIDKILTLTDKGGSYILAALHELAHAWDNPDIYIPFDAKGDPNTQEAAHNKYVSGVGSKYCIFKYLPDSDLPMQISKMQFSDEIEQKLTNTLFHNPY